MTIETINGCVLIPDRCNWAVKPKWSRRWPDNIVGAATAAEDRSGLRSEPMERIEHSCLTFSVRERNQLIARVIKALKTGNAALPLWGRQAYTTAPTESTEVDVKTEPPLGVGDWVMISSPKEAPADRSIRINCGGGATGSWLADQFYSAGDAITTTNSINVASVTGPAPTAVYQSAREVVGVNTQGVLTYTLDGWAPGVSTFVRLHLAEIDPTMDGTFQRKMRIRVQGADFTEWDDYEVYLMAGALDKAIILEAYVTPGADGRITVTLTGLNPHIVGIPSAFHYPTMLNGLEAHQTTYAVRQLSAVSTGHLEWVDPLPVVFPAGSLVAKLIFGRFSLAGSLPQLTDHHAALPGLIVEEPAGTGTTAVIGACPVPDSLDLPYEVDPGDVVVGTRYATKYRWNLPGGTSPNAALLYDQIAWNMVIADNEFAEALQAMFWEYVPGTQNSPQYDALVKYESGSTDPLSATGDDLNMMSSGYWVLTVII